LGRSQTRHSAAYQRLLREVILHRGVRTVADLGCGDWKRSTALDWTGVRYVGYDSRPEIVAANRDRFARAGVRFEALDLSRDELPKADLAICKDVLHHWPNADVADFLRRLRGYRYVLLTHDYRRYDRGGVLDAFRRHEVGTPNADVEHGEWRPLHLNASPFVLRARRLGLVTVTRGRTVWRKEVLLLTNQSPL